MSNQIQYLSDASTLAAGAPQNKESGLRPEAELVRQALNRSGAGTADRAGASGPANVT
jgi:hypothetical protein